jgi:S-adenosylmethionine:tRNA ribosyltransferase-isomerase
VRLEDLDYELPPDRIAQRPPERREDARLLVLERKTGERTDSRIPDLARWLSAGDALVLNETRVRPARLDVHRPTGGRVELLFVRPEPGDPGAGPRRWRVLARPAKRARPGETLETADASLALAIVEVGADGERVVEAIRGDVVETLHRVGEPPLPPYIHRAPEPGDRERYQTVYARVEGAVAAPTAGLHFTTEHLELLRAAGIAIATTLLHVGPGTFRPVTESDPARHRMDEEYFEVREPAVTTLRAARAAGGRIVAVGTTVVRALESACDANDGRLGAASGWTRKFIVPPYRFQAVDALLTNFHLPRTTLLLLVAAFAGEASLKASYRHAIDGGYRFYSYGDAMLVV